MSENVTQRTNTWSASLGVSDCETCGGNFEEVEVHNVEGTDLYWANYRVGCYGGGCLDESEAVNLAGLRAWLNAELGHMSGFRGIRKRLFASVEAHTPDYAVEYDADGNGTEYDSAGNAYQIG